jgi:hypothetical protein
VSFRYRGDPAWLVTHPVLGDGDGATFGTARIPVPNRPDLFVIFADAQEPTSEGWEHVSVSSRRLPTWTDMVRVKDLFWDAEDCVVQFHPPQSDYVNQHPTCLHLWRHATVPFPRPPRGLVG